MTVPLLPPIGRSNGFGMAEATPLAEGPAFVLGRPSTRYEARWHRVRSGVTSRRYNGTEYTLWLLWCGPHRDAANVVGSDVLPTGDPLCGTCEGRYSGHARDGGLVFDPDELKTPKTCPYTTLYVPVTDGFNVGRCLACNRIAPLRAAGGPYNPREIITRHPPLQLVPGCAFHGWRQLVRHDDTAMCRCQAAAHAAQTTTGA